MSEQDKDEIIAKAVQLCKWVGWMRNSPLTLVRKVEELKTLIEDKTGKEIEEYT